MYYLSGLDINHVPRFDTLEDKGDPHRAPDALAHNALWSALRFSVVGGLGASVELRLTAHAHTRQIGLSLLILAERQDVNAAPMLRVLERLLPSDYGWSHTKVTPYGEIVTPTVGAEDRWYVSRLTRKITLFDLPMVLATEIASQHHAPQTANIAAGQMTFLAAQAHQKPNGGPNRRIPLLGIPWDAQRLQGGLCIPLLNQLKQVQPQHLRLFEELQQCAPAVVSIAMHPAPTEIPGDRAIATHLYSGLTAFGGPSSERSGGLKPGEVTFDRYSAPLEQLCRMSVRVAGLDEYTSVAIAHSVAAQFGGLNTFDIQRPTNPLGDLQKIAIPEVYEGDTLSRWLSTERADADKIYLPFLERLRHLYTLDEAEKLLALPSASHAGLPGVKTRPRPPFFPPSTGLRPAQESAPAGRVRIGLARGSGLQISDDQEAVDKLNKEQAFWHSIPARDLCKHALIVGTTGSGKTVTTTSLVKEIDRLGIPFLVVEPVKTEYFDNLSREFPNIVRYRFEASPATVKNSDFLALDPMRLQRGVSISRHVSYLKSCFEAAFPMDEVMALVLENGLREYYVRPRGESSSADDVRSAWSCGLPKDILGGIGAHVIIDDFVFPSFDTFQRFFLEEYIEETFAPKNTGVTLSGDMLSRAFEWQQIFKRRFENLDKSPLGESFRRADARYRDGGLDYDLFPLLLDGQVVLELDALTDPEQKAMAMAFVMTLLYERRQADDAEERELRRAGEQVEPAPAVRHALILEEAHRLLSSGASASRGESVGLSASAKAVGMFIDMLAEIRAYGQSLLIVEQIPKKIAPEVIKNTNLKIMLRLPSGEDRDYLGTAMNFNDEQKRFVANLRTGQFVCFEETVDQPILLQAPPPD